jgi:hypothetical protein
MLTTLIHTRPALGYTVALLVSGFVTVIGVGGAIAAFDYSPGTSVFLGFVGAVGVLLLVALTLEVRHRTRRPFAVLETSADGLPATRLPYGWASVVPAVGVLVVAVVACALGLWVALSQGNTGGSVIAVVLGAVSAVWLLPVAIGTVRAGGLDLTSAGIGHRHLGSGWWLAWEDLEGVSPGNTRDAASPARSAALVGLLERPGTNVRRRRYSRWGWSGDVVAPSQVVGIAVRHLSVDAPTLAFLVASYLDDPSLRDQLGTSDSLEWRILQRDS